MLTKDDLKKIGNLIKPLNSQFDEFAKNQEKSEKKLNKTTASLVGIERTLKDHTGKLMGIEKNIGAALEVNEEVIKFRSTVEEHEQRISQLETV